MSMKCLPAILLLALTLPVPAPDRTVFFDDFSGSEVDRPKWNVLGIRPRFRKGFTTPEGHAFDFVSGRIDTRGKVTFTYGTAAARMKLAAGAGFWPAFWALGDGDWPATGEI